MKINNQSKLRYRIIDFINAQAWFVAAISLTISAIACIWSLGLITMLISR